MNAPDSPASPTSWGLLTHLGGHVLLFDSKPGPHYEAAAGARVLIVAVTLEALRLGLIRLLYPAVPLLILVPFLVVVALLSVPYMAGLRLSQTGF